MRISLALLAFLLAFSPVLGQSDARPTAPRLLPSDSMAYFRIDDTVRFRRLVRESSAGRMAADPKVSPMVSQIYTGGKELLTAVSDRMGVTVDEMLSISQGEFSIALVPTDPQPTVDRISKARQEEAKAAEAKGTDESPEAIRERLSQKRREQQLTTRLSFGIVAIIDTGDQVAVLRRLLENSEKLMQQAGGFQQTTQSEQGVDIVSLQRGARPESMHYFVHDGTLVIGTNRDAVRSILLRWKGQLDDDRLSSNTNFTTVMSHCVGSEQTRPQMTFYVDPFGVLNTVTASGGGAGMFTFIVQNLGMEGIKGVGGSGFVGGDRFETITHLHLLIDSRRGGVLSVVCPQEGPVGPPNFIPSDATGFMAINWDVDKTVAATGRVYDQIRGEGSFDEDVLKQAGNRLKIDVQDDLLNQLTGRFTISSWLEPPARLGSQVSLYGAQLKDPKLMAETLDKAMENLPNWKSEQFAGVTVHAGAETKVPETMRDYLRQGQPHVAVVGDHVVFTDSKQFMQRIITTQAGGGFGEIANLPEYDLIAGELSGQLDGRPPFMFSFSRPEEAFRAIYDLISNPQMRQGLRQLAERNPVARMFHQALQDNALPPLSVFTQYLAPAGSFAYDDTSGLHMTSFGLQK